MRVILLFFLVACAALAGRLFIMQIVHHAQYARLATRQHGVIQELSGERGIITAHDKEGNRIPLALNKAYKVLVASPAHIENPEETAGIIAKEFNLDYTEVLRKLSKAGDPYEVLARKIEPDAADQFSARGIAGISFEDEMRRVYPDGRVVAHLVGFVQSDQGEESGRYGIERFYNAELAGATGVLEGVKDASGFLIALGRRILTPPKDGASVDLTIDYTIQRRAQEEIAKAREKWGAALGIVIVMDPKTGRILADAGDPSFDPNAFSREQDFSVFLNAAVESSYEVGSVMKPITMAAGLEEKVITPESRYNDTGELKIGGFTIRNFDGNAYHTQTMTQVLEKSLNTGAAHVAGLLGHERQLAYLKKFGLGEKTNVDLPGEVSGNISNMDAGRDVDFVTASFGQGIAVTPLQMASAIGAIANHGVLMRPYVAEKITDSSGNEIKKESETVRTVISPDAADRLTKMLISAVRNGFENRAGVKGYFVAGKTGTAQAPNKTGRGYSDALIHTFIGYAPAFDPKFLILLQLNDPHGNRFAANTLTPVFHDLAEFILNYYQVPPDEK